MSNSEDLPDCPDCGSPDVEVVPDEPGELVCSDCGLVFDERSRVSPGTDVDWKEEEDLDFSKTVRDDSTKHEHWTEQTSPAIVGLIQEPNRTYHEYYRIENPREFFEGCSNEQDELKRIRESDLEPFETLELPHIEWRYSVH